MSTMTILAAENLLQPDNTLYCEPHFKHDCDRCVFLGIEFREQKMDVWFCRERDTLIYRYGPEGDYGSMPLELARGVAEQQGFSSWVQAVSRYDDWDRGVIEFEVTDPSEWDGYVTNVGLYNDVLFRETERNVFLRDRHGNPIGVAAKGAFHNEARDTSEDTYLLRLHEDVTWMGEVGYKDFASRKALFLYVELVIQTGLDSGH